MRNLSFIYFYVVHKNAAEKWLKITSLRVTVSILKYPRKYLCCVNFMKTRINLTY